MARYDKHRKVDPALVQAYRDAHPDWSLQEIAGKLGVSRQRVSQILERIKQKKVQAAA